MTAAARTLPIPSRRRRPRTRALRAVAALGVATLVAGCGSGTSSDSDGSGSGVPAVKVVATTSQLGDIVRAVGGDAVDVHQILQPGGDPHEFEPRAGDLAATTAARVLFASGLGLDAWVTDVHKQSGSDATLMRLGDGVPTKRANDDAGEHAGHDDEGEHHDDEGENPDDAGEHADHDDEGDHADHEHEGHDHAGEFDPHWWHDPTNVEHAIGAIRDAIVRAEPRVASAVRRSAAAYLAKVQALDADIKRCIATVPRSERKLVTSHDAFDYFAQRYGITVVGAAIPSQTTQAQPSAGQVTALVKLIRRERVKAIFPESSVNPKLAAAIARETGVSSELSLYGDSLGDPGSDGATYLDMQRHNADAVVRGFTGGKHGCSPTG